MTPHAFTWVTPLLCACFARTLCFACKKLQYQKAGTTAFPYFSRMNLFTSGEVTAATSF
jgi:hypothetical protein